MICTLALLSAAAVIVDFWRSPAAIPEMARAMIEANIVARLVGLLLLVPAIVALGLTDRVDNAAAITALSAIAGYVLGAIGSIRPPSKNGG